MKGTAAMHVVNWLGNGYLGFCAKHVCYCGLSFWFALKMWAMLGSKFWYKSWLRWEDSLMWLSHYWSDFECHGRIVGDYHRYIDWNCVSLRKYSRQLGLSLLSIPHRFIDRGSSQIEDGNPIFLDTKMVLPAFHFRGCFVFTSSTGLSEFEVSVPGSWHYRVAIQWYLLFFVHPMELDVPKSHQCHPDSAVRRISSMRNGWKLPGFGKPRSWERKTSAYLQRLDSCAQKCW